MRVLDAARHRQAQGRAVYDLSAGQPGTPAPEPVRAAARAGLDRDHIGYTPAAGLPQLRAAIAQHYQVRYGLAVDAANVVVTTGASGGILLALLAAFDVGDRVAVARPGYPAYRNLLTALGCRPVDLDCGPVRGFRFDATALAGIEPVAGVMLASPANPTGTALRASELAAVAADCRAQGARLISDEIYHGIRFGDVDHSVWEFDRTAIVVNSFSKYFSMTGWRLGWLLVPDELLDAVDRLATNVALCAPTLSQLAAVAAFECYDELDAHVAHYRRNRDRVLTGLAAIGLDRFAPADGAFYAYVDISHRTDDSTTWAARLLDDTGVAVAPGIDFDELSGHRFIRLSFAGDTTMVNEAVSVLGEWLEHQPEPSS
jgi:aspartate/methionine/tyrosine aminotransferase